MPSDKAVKIVPHNLFSREIKPLHNWHHWLERWQAAETIQEMHGLLQQGFKVQMGEGGYWEPEYALADRVAFYVSIADGWADHYLLKKSEDAGEYVYGRDKHGNRIQMQASELRCILAREAFDQLSANFFNQPEVTDHGYWNWAWEEAFTGSLFPVIQHFFRAEESRYYGVPIRIRNLSWPGKISSHETKAVDFLLLLIKKVWNWQEERVEKCRKEEEQERIRAQNAERRARFDSAKPWTLEVLTCLGRFNVLRQIESSLSTEDVAKLTEIALRTEIDDPERPVYERKSRKARTLEEALYGGSRVAAFVLGCGVKKSVREKHEKIRKAVEARLKAERTIQEQSR